MRAEVLIVDDEPDIRLLIAELLKEKGMIIRESSTAEEALLQIQNRRPHVIILDIWLQGSRMDGLEMLREVRRDYPHLPVLIISGHATIEKAVEAIKLGAYHFIEKPLQSESLVVTVERALEATRLKRENLALQSRTGESPHLIGKSSIINQLRTTIEKLAPTNSRVMIFGAPGTGKGLVARLLHQASTRALGPFVVLHCATIESHLLAQELFGVDSSPSRKIGLLEQANGGTLLLDEVADIPRPLQNMLMKVLYQNAFIPINGSKPVEIDVRIFSTTNKNMQIEIKGERFRRDLFDRLNVVSVRVPPLSERRQDILLLIQQFMSMTAELSGLPILEFEQDTLTLLQNYDWPGNVRQLRNMIEWLLIMCGSSPQQKIQVDMLPPEIQSMTPLGFQLEGGSQIMGLPLREAREIFEREYLEIQMTRFDGNISRTAAFVGMERSALHRKLKSLGIQNFRDL